MKNKRGIISRVFTIIFGAVFLPLVASAHVGYVIPHDEFISHEGSDTAFLVSGVTQSPKDVVVGTLVLLFIVGAIIYLRSRPGVKRFLAGTREKLSSYQELLPWMARLSLGIALLGAGTAGALISPVFAGGPHIAFLEIVLGFMLLIGFLITPALLATIILFIFGLSHSSYLIGNADMLGLALALLLLGSTRPGLDDILGIDSWKGASKFRKFAPLVLRIGLGVAFIFLAVFEKFLNPHDSELVVTTFHLTRAIPVSPALWVLGAGLTEFLLGTLLILGYEIRLVSVISFIVISLSFFYFRESVYSHVTLFGALSMLVVTGAGSYSLDSIIRKKRIQ